MTLSFKRFQEWQKEAAILDGVRGWLSHIGATGRSFRGHTDILSLSPDHCKAPSFTVAGQYTEGGTNYWDSPTAFNDAMKVVILRRFKELSAEALGLIEAGASEMLIAAKGEIAEVQMAIDRAEIEAITPRADTDVGTR